MHPAKTHISLGIHPHWSESLMCAQWAAKNPRFLHRDTEDFDQSGWSESLLGAQVILLVWHAAAHFVSIWVSYWWVGRAMALVNDVLFWKTLNIYKIHQCTVNPLIFASNLFLQVPLGQTLLKIYYPINWQRQNVITVKLKINNYVYCTIGKSWALIFLRHARWPMLAIGGYQRPLVAIGTDQHHKL